jgi:phosphate uptake regulator
MPKRKIQLTGGGVTFIISLPKKWVKKHKIKQGDEITLVESKSGTLTLLPPIYEEIKKSSVILEDLLKVPLKKEDAIEQYIISRYLKGVREISIVSKKKIDYKDFELIRLAVHKLMGYEIVKHEAKRIVIRDFLSLESIEVKELISRLCEVISQLYYVSLESPRTNEDVTPLLTIKAEAEKLDYLLSRILLSCSSDPRMRYQMKLDTRDIPLFNEMIIYLRDIAKSSIGLAEDAIHYSGTNDQTTHISTLNKEIKDHLDEIQKCLESRDKLRAISLLHTVEATNHKTRQLLRDHLQDNKDRGSLVYYTGRNAASVMKILKTVNRILSISSVLAYLESDELALEAAEIILAVA